MSKLATRLIGVFLVLVPCQLMGFGYGYSVDLAAKNPPLSPRGTPESGLGRQGIEPSRSKKALRGYLLSRRAPLTSSRPVSYW